MELFVQGLFSIMILITVTDKELRKDDFELIN